ncbi:MAG: PLDc N-terminal domain-containing protein [Victivallales bacterium]
MIHIVTIITILTIALVAFVLAAIVLWVWSIGDCVRNETNKDDKLIWLLVTIFLGVFGALFYIFIRRPERIKQNNSELPINRDAIISIILGGCGFYTFGAVIGIFLCIAGIVYGNRALRQIKTGDTRGGEIAKSGIVMCCIPFAFIFIGLIILLLFPYAFKYVNII